MKKYRSELIESTMSKARYLARGPFRPAFLLVLALTCWCCSRSDSPADRNTNQAPVSNSKSGNPLILDIRGDGLDLSGRTKTNLATGETQEHSWTKQNTDDSFLIIDAASVREAGFSVLDKEGNPVNGLTLPRDGLRVRGPDGRETIITDGWQLLGVFDATGDGRINSTDRVWQHLKLFTDADADGTIGIDELKSFSDSNVGEILLTNLSSSRVDQFRNSLVDGNFTRRDGSPGLISAVRFGAGRAGG